MQVIDSIQVIQVIQVIDSILDRSQSLFYFVPQEISQSSWLDLVNHHEERLNVGVVGDEHHAQGTSFAALIKLRQKLAA